MPYELFISYSRKDNTPQQPEDASGWVTALHNDILANHRGFSTEPLRIFFDTSEIESLDYWRNRILTGLRESKILLVCLSPNYFNSPPCLWEWEEYFKRQIHALMGQESVAPIYFVEAPDSDEQLSIAWAEAVSRKAVAPTERPQWEKRWKDWRAAIGRYQWVDLKPFFPNGLVALQNEEVRRRMDALGTNLWERIKRARRATGVPGNLLRFNPHFIGRTTELRQLHDSLALGAVGVVTAINGLGGQGKTELATAYAHGWADCYAAGLWVLSAETKKEILPLIGELCAELELPLSAGADETAEQRGRRVLAELKRRVVESRSHDGAKGAACLVLLDNVSEPGLLAEPQLARLPCEDWLRVIVTTREGPEKFGVSREKSLAFIAVDALAEDDAARLIEEHQPGAKWPGATAATDAAATREIVRTLGGFTLAVESVAIHLGLHTEIRPADYHARLLADGLSSVDALPANTDVADQMRHREKQLGLVLDQTLSQLTSPERAALDYAALLPPDSIPWPWLRELVGASYPDVLTSCQGHNDPWQTLRRRLEGKRLLVQADHPDIARLHRMIAALLETRNKAAAQGLRSRLVSFAHRATERLAKAAEWGKAGAIWELKTAGSVAENLIKTGDEIGIALAALIAHPLVEHWELETAERILRRALALCDSTAGSLNRERSSILSSLGGVLREKREFEEAERLIREAIAIEKVQIPLDALGLARKWNNLGLLLRDKNLLREGERVFKEALALARAALTTDFVREAEVELAILSNNLADLLMGNGRLEDAVSLFNYALSQLISLFGDSHPDVATAIHNLAALHEAMGQYRKAASMYEESLQIYRQVFGAKHLRSAATQVNLAIALSRTDASTRAEPELRSGIQILREIREDHRYRVKPMKRLLEDYLKVLGRIRLSRLEAKISLLQVFPEYTFSNREYWRYRLVAISEHYSEPVFLFKRFVSRRVGALLANFCFIKERSGV